MFDFSGVNIPGDSSLTYLIFVFADDFQISDRCCSVAAVFDSKQYCRYSHRPIELPPESFVAAAPKDQVGIDEQSLP